VEPAQQILDRSSSRRLCRTAIRRLIEVRQIGKSVTINLSIFNSGCSRGLAGARASTGLNDCGPPLCVRADESSESRKVGVVRLWPYAQKI